MSNSIIILIWIYVNAFFRVLWYVCWSNHPSLFIQEKAPQNLLQKNTRSWVKVYHCPVRQLLCPVLWKHQTQTDFLMQKKSHVTEKKTVKLFLLQQDIASVSEVWEQHHYLLVFKEHKLSPHLVSLVNI